ncbi:MAG TPA: Xaa-Pro aminopeptidase [Polyangia bacterium]|nr:Xaa-Pro aminopeptidase [Polyangia bacterium]
MEPEQREACERRRGRLAAQLGNRPALIAAGTPRPRNYAANLYPFRASSHFLYLFALPLRGAVAFYDGAGWTLYLPEPGADDALWEGPQSSLDAISEEAGCPARPLSRLPANIRGRAVATLPAPDLETCAEQSRLLGREIRRGVLDVLDAPLADALIELRLVHDDAAVAELRRAAEATAAAHRAGMRVTRAGLTEAAVRATMEAALSARGMTCAYPSIVTVHGEVLHNERHDNVLAEDDLLLCDVGAETPGGWAGDVTRTWPVNGRYSTPQRELYQVVLSAQRQAISAVTPGARYRNIHLLACQALAGGLCELGVLRGNPIELVADGVLALLFPHGVGHLIGLDVHDMEDLGDRAGYAPGRQRATEFGLRNLRLDRDLAPGMAVTIEPGLYVVPAILNDPALSKKAAGRLDRARLATFAGIRGIRIEDDVLVTADGADVLTAAIPKAPDDVEAVRAGR